MKKIILTILALTMLTTPVVSSANFAGGPIPDGVMAEAEEAAERIANIVVSLTEDVMEKLGIRVATDENGTLQMGPEEMILYMETLSAYEALVVLQMRSEVEELRMEGRGNSPLARKINYCCGIFMNACRLGKKDFDKARKILSSEDYASHPYVLDFESIFG